MTVIDKVQEQLKGSRFLTKKDEIEELVRVLEEDEDIKKLTDAMLNATKGLLVATNKRIIFVSKKNEGKFFYSDAIF